MGLGSVIAMSCGIGLRHSLDPVLLWLWCRQAAAAPIRPLAQEPPHATGAILKRKKIKTSLNVHLVRGVMLSPVATVVSRTVSVLPSRSWQSRQGTVPTGVTSRVGWSTECGGGHRGSSQPGPRVIAQGIQGMQGWEGWAGERAR